MDANDNDNDHEMTMTMTQTSVFSQINWVIDGNVQTFPRTIMIIEAPHK